MAQAAKHKKWEYVLLTGGGRARKECKELEWCEVLTRKNEMILDKGNLLRRLFKIECEIEKFILVFATILVLDLFSTIVTL